MVPSAVTPSPMALAPVARNEAQPSVVPATTVQPGARPRRGGQPRQHRPERRAGRHHLGQQLAPDAERVEPVGPGPADRVEAELERVVVVADAQAPGQAWPRSSPPDAARSARRDAAPAARAAGPSGEVAPCAPLSGGATSVIRAARWAALASLYMPAGSSGVPCSSASSSVPEVPSTASESIRWPGVAAPIARMTLVDGSPPQLRVLAQPAGRSARRRQRCRRLRHHGTVGVDRHAAHARGADVDTEMDRVAAGHAGSPRSMVER